MIDRKKNLISMIHCKIQNKSTVLIPEISWAMSTGEAWLVTGPNGGGKAAFLNALAGSLDIAPAFNVSSGHYSSVFDNSTEIVSLERAAHLIEEERARDESDYIEGGVDHGRTARMFIKEACKENCAIMDSNPFVKLCGIEKVLDRGIKYLSTGEIRRTLLCMALLSGKKLLVISDPFTGLDVDSRSILLNFFNNMAQRQVSTDGAGCKWPFIILGMERYVEIPACITHVLEFTNSAVSFCGKRADYERVLLQRQSEKAEQESKMRSSFAADVRKLHAETILAHGESHGSGKPLVQMKDVNVGWGNHTVIRHLDWTLFAGEHWLIRGPNGAGKTTFLELITGDNMQVYSNNVSLFGRRRGTGETIWEIKAKLGIVSYRLHVEYRMVGGGIESVVISGFHDSIGLYEKATDSEVAAARKWLKLGGFDCRGEASFSDLSYGEQRAVLILRAAVKCPPILILDEPCHGLDETYRQKILDLLETIASTGTTTLLHVTHDPSEVLACEKHILDLYPDKDPMYCITVNKRGQNGHTTI